MSARVVCDQCGREHEFKAPFTLHEEGSMGYSADRDFCNQACLAKWCIDQQQNSVEWWREKWQEVDSPSGRKRK